MHAYIGSGIICADIYIYIYNTSGCCEGDDTLIHDFGEILSYWNNSLMSLFAKFCL